MCTRAENAPLLMFIRNGTSCFLFVLTQLVDAAHAGRCLRASPPPTFVLLFSPPSFPKNHGWSPGLDSVPPARGASASADLKQVTSMFAGSGVVTAGCGAAV